MIFWKSRAERYKNGRYHEIHGQICGQFPKKKREYCTVMVRYGEKYGRGKKGVGRAAMGHSRRAALDWYVHLAMDIRWKYWDSLLIFYGQIYGLA